MIKKLLAALALGAALMAPAVIAPSARAADNVTEDSFDGDQYAGDVAVHMIFDDTNCDKDSTNHCNSSWNGAKLRSVEIISSDGYLPAGGTLQVDVWGQGGSCVDQIIGSGSGSWQRISSRAVVWTAPSNLTHVARANWVVLTKPSSGSDKSDIETSDYLNPYAYSLADPSCNTHTRDVP